MTAEDPDCRCAGRDEGRHDMLCEQALRTVFGHLGLVPADVRSLLRERGTVVPEPPDGTCPGETGAGPASLPGRPKAVAFPGNAVWSPQSALPAGAPEHAHQVTVRYFTATMTRDVVVMTDDYLRRRDDGSLDAYLETVIRPRLKRTWHPFPADTGARWVLPVVLRDGTYQEDPDAPNPLDAASGPLPGPVPAAPSRPSHPPVTSRETRRHPGAPPPAQGSSPSR